MKKVKKWLTWVLTGLMVGSMIPGTALAVEMERGKSTLTVNQSKVAFAGHEWWVIGDETNGVYSQTGHITLLGAENDFGNTAFRTGRSSSFDDSSQYSGDNWYYANNPDGMNPWTSPNEYAGSTLQQKMVALAGEIPEKEQAVISARSLAGGGTYQNPSTDGIAGQGVENQKLWALSEAEWSAINNNDVRAYNAWWWLRSTSPIDGNAARQGYSSGGNLGNCNVSLASVAARPALSLNLSSVLFTSAASETSGKSIATVGSNLVQAQETTGTVKFTMMDQSQTLQLEATVAQSTQTGETLSFSYSGATTGTNQYISCVLTDDQENVKYYGKLTDSSSAASGALSVPLTNVTNGTYTLKIFSEEANGAKNTDFCSEPVTMKVVVENGSGTVSKFGGVILHEHEWNKSEWNTDDTHHWHECQNENCPITNNSQKDEYAEHIYNQENTDQGYLANAASCTAPATYYKSCVCGKNGTETFTGGETNTNNHKHTENKSEISAGCETVGYTAGVYCTDCGTWVSGHEEIPATGHGELEIEKAKKATCTAEGYTGDKVCTVCDEVVEQGKAIQKLAHSYKDGKCTVCGAADPDYVPATPDKPDSDVPQTGDSSNLALWFTLMGVGAAGLCGALLLQKRRRSKVK